MSAAAVQSPTHTVAGIEHCLALGSIPLDRFLSDAKVPRSTWTTWRAGRARPRPDRWAAVTAAFDALVAEATPVPADLRPEAVGAEPVVLTGSSASTGAPPSFTLIATATLAAPPRAARARSRRGQGAFAEPTLVAITARLVPLIRREHLIQRRLDKLETDDVLPELRERLDRISTRMLGRIDRWTRWLMRHVTADNRVMAVKADAYIELVTAGWTGGTDDLGETLALSVCKDAVNLRNAETCLHQAAEEPDAQRDTLALLEEAAAIDFEPYDFGGWMPDTKAEWVQHSGSVLVMVRMAYALVSLGKTGAIEFVAKLVDGKLDVDAEATLYDHFESVGAFFEIYAEVMKEARCRLIIAGATLEKRRHSASAARAAA